ncbi:hypothetical protein QTO34_007624 [Cnephaeus nilssonii]|uniref:Regulator of G-protein signaling 22 n=1 Tax=Cnephaeus nilssonii TaxID=3371016 RepID=A0AA40HJD1_CNENI|nr:hypothetical protein QTO34_007624 [Eptesicus nilssonii]
MPEKRLTAGRWRPAGGRGGRGGRRPPAAPAGVPVPARVPLPNTGKRPPRPPISPERVVRVSTTSSPHPHASPADTASLEGTTFCSSASFSAAERESPQEPVTPRLRRPPPRFPLQLRGQVQSGADRARGLACPERAPVSGLWSTTRRETKGERHIEDVSNASIFSLPWCNRPQLPGPSQPQGPILCRLPAPTLAWRCPHPPSPPHPQFPVPQSPPPPWIAPPRVTWASLFGAITEPLPPINRPPAGGLGLPLRGDCGAMVGPQTNRIAPALAGLEDSLATDDFLVDYFNEFLSLPTFSEAIRFNVNYGVFEVVNNAPQLLEKQLKRILQSQQPRNPIYDVVRKAKNDINPAQMSAPSTAETININYSVMCLNREQGIQWIKKERLPAFLESDCYFEYRLAKLVSQVRWSKSGMNITLDTTFSPWVMRKVPTPPPPVIEDDNAIIMKKFYISLGEASYSETKDWFALAKQSQQTVSTFPALHSKVDSPFISSVSESVIFDDGVHPRMQKDPSKATRPISELEEEEEEGSIALPDTPSHALLRIYLEKQPDAESRAFHFSTYEEFLISYINFVLAVVINQILDEPFQEGPGYINFNNITEVIVDEFEPTPDKKDVLGETTQPTKEKVEERLEEADSKRERTGSEIRADWCLSHKTYDIGNRNEFERFKTFMKGTLGERYWWLWMDIERLKVLKDAGRHQRHLEKMKKNYLVSSGDCYLSTEILTKLKLLDGSQWNKAHLINIQIDVVKPILLYWAPRFCVTHSCAIRQASAELKLWHRRQEKPRKDIDPFPQIATLLPLRPKSCIPQISDTEGSAAQPEARLTAGERRETIYSNPKPLERRDFAFVSPKDSMTEKGSRQMSERSQVIHLTSYTDISECLKPELNRRFTYSEEPLVKTVADGALGGSDMENLLQSLYVENRAGFFFTKFCEHSGNELWKNSVYFWFDLQAYHQLFYQETLHPFKVCKQAQDIREHCWMLAAPSTTLTLALMTVLCKSADRTLYFSPARALDKFRWSNSEVSQSLPPHPQNLNSEINVQ